MLDRYEQHTLKCSSCKKAHKTFETLQKLLTRAAVVFCAAAGVPPEIQLRLIFAGLAITLINSRRTLFLLIMFTLRLID
ncbi:putative pheophorbide a oxygenase [Helianthus annuus]|nr:putative pheophorbide a oxygenase [Helianthus annuus]KAJ0686875.1 putative pheophorbide a oxygenase [Helianthus annuus]